MLFGARVCVATDWELSGAAMVADPDRYEAIIAENERARPIWALGRTYVCVRWRAVLGARSYRPARLALEAKGLVERI
jgi:hypothetical protein